MLNMFSEETRTPFYSRKIDLERAYKDVYQNAPFYYYSETTTTSVYIVYYTESGSTEKHVDCYISDFNSAKELVKALNKVSSVSDREYDFQPLELISSADVLNRIEKLKKVKKI